MPSRASFRWVGDRAILRELSGDLVGANRAARVLRAELAELAAGEVEDLIPGARSVLVLLREGTEASGELLEMLAGEHLGAASSERSGRLHEIPLAYGGADGEDLKEVARLHGLSEKAVVLAHSAVVYEVGFIGFSPGFPYLFGLPATLATPRLATPRTRVPAGSIAIGGEWTGIYPRATPGGWRLIGRTDVVLFDPRCDPPALLAPGDQVRFLSR